jgi:branched-chain amino acid transport system permease protein
VLVVTRNLFGELPGISMVIYGTVLIVIVMFMPRGIAGCGQSLRRLAGFKERARA